jgi:murein DD-endopeptidase MepM/ murein hydrolase activator NlpD
MNVIVFSRDHGRARQFDLRSPAVVTAALATVLLVVGIAFAAGSMVGARFATVHPDGKLAVWSEDIAAQKAEIEAARRQLQQKVDVLATRVGQMNAHVIRLDALGKRITRMAKLDKGEFDFDSPPPVGGLENLELEAAPQGVPSQAAAVPALTDMLDELAARLEDRERQLGALENVMLTRELRHEVYPQGRPVLSGFLSSFFGYRVDPFTGRTAFHAGVDFAGPPGSQIVAVATGVVTYAGQRMGYGNVVEVTHGNGYVTRYAHNLKNVAKVGDTVQKGDVLSLMGSTGRSTGPHLHFEVLRDGRQINPMSFINQNAASPLTAAR